MGEFVTAFLAHGFTCPGGETAGRCAEPIAAPPATAPGLVCRNAALLTLFALHDKSRAGRDKSQDDLRGGEKELPEGLKRERTRPLDKDLGRVDEKAAHDRAKTK